MCIRIRFLTICCRNRYDHDNNIIEIPELRADQKKVEIVSPTTPTPNNDKIKKYQPNNGPGGDDQICEATPLVQNQKETKNRKVSLVTEPMQTMETYITNGTKIEQHESPHQDVHDPREQITSNAPSSVIPSPHGNPK